MKSSFTQPEIDFGPLKELMADSSVTDIMVNGPYQVYIQRQGKMEKANLVFENSDHLMQTIQTMLSPLGIHLYERSPIVNARLPDGSRLNAVIPPLALNGPALTIRKLFKYLLNFEKIVSFKSLTEEMADFLKVCAAVRLNLLISGGMGSGKTVLLNIIASHIPEKERIITIENETSLRLPQSHVVSLESRSADMEEKGAVTIRDLLLNCLYMRPDRILVDELGGSEVFDALRLMDKGYSIMSTIGADSPLGALERLEMVAKINDPNLPTAYLRSLISSTIDLVVQQNRLEDSTRKIVRISEVQAITGGEYVLNDVYAFQRKDFLNNRVIGHFESHPLSQTLQQKIESSGGRVSPELFRAEQAQTA